MPAAQEFQSLRARLAGCPRLERRSIGRWLTKVARNSRSGRPVDRSLARISTEIERAETVLSGRRAAADRSFQYPKELPVSLRRAELLAAIREHQVIVVCGETGSGKTTQLPKLCLEAGRGVDGLIGHTQPRRVAAQSVATRIAEETGTELGGLVGWQVRFQKAYGAGTCVKVMTDGVLLAETPDDRDLDRYDTLIIDEAHERSLNIDFLLGYLANLLKRRSDLKLIITSATIDAERFSAHFDNCPVLDLSGRTHPIEIEYLEPADLGLEGIEVTSGSVIEAAIRRLEGWDGLQDVLVFLPGEREIRDALDHLAGALGDRWECLPLYARLPSAQQQLVFTPSDRRRLVLATNVAETSLTVPRVTAVVDTGLARVSRFSARARIERLPVEQVSQASARQRAGRCGRIAPGRCLRLYPESVFENSPEFTQPEILRSNLASVILRMLGLGLGAIDDFPFLDRPSSRLVDEGWATLHELGAIDRPGMLTEVGRRLARLPVDPRIGRMLVAAIEERVLPEVLVIASALSIQDPRLRPPGQESAADLAHAPWRDQKSDFAGLLRLWVDYQAQHRTEGASATRRWCTARFLSNVRMREWFEVHRQLRETVREVFELKVPTLRAANLADGGWGGMHRSILSGLVSNLGRRNEERLYDMVNGAQFQVHPASGLVRTDAPWLMVAEVMETTRRFGRFAAKIRGDWVERVAPHLVRREYEDPHYLVDSGQVAAYERVHYGQLVVVPRRRVPFGPIDPATARDVFIHEALVEERLRTRAEFLKRNIALRTRVEQLEEKGRRHDLLAPSEQRFAFYDQRVPKDIHSAPSFERWRTKAERRAPGLLVMSESDLMDAQGRGIDSAQFPDTLDPGGADLRLDYRHDPGVDSDGVTVEVSLAALGQLDVTRLHWMVPGLLTEKVEVLIRSLPKRVRTRFTPIAQTAADAAEALEFGVGDLFEELARYLTRLGGLEVTARDFDRERLPEHLSMVILVTDGAGVELARGREPAFLLESLRREVDDAFTTEVEPLAETLCPSGSSELPEEPLPESLLVPGVTGRLVAWVAMQHDGTAFAPTLRASRAEAMRLHHRGITTALVGSCGTALSGHLDWLLEGRGLDVRYTGLRGPGTVREQIESLLIDACFLKTTDSWSIRSREQFAACLDAGHGRLSESAESVVDAVEQILIRLGTLSERFSISFPEQWGPVIAAMKSEITALVPTPLADAGWKKIGRAPRMLEVIERRLDRIAEKGIGRELRDRADRAAWEDRLAAARAIGVSSAAYSDYERQLDEFSAHQVAPSLALPGAGSVRRLTAAWNSVCAEDSRLAPVR